MLSESFCLRAVVTLWLIAGAGGCSTLRSPHAPAPQLPPPDSRVQRWLETITPSTPPNVLKTADDEVAALRRLTDSAAQIRQARKDGTLSDKTWLLQVLRFVSRLDGGMYAWGVMLEWTRFSVVELQIDALAAVQILSPYMDSADQRVSRTASGMIDAALEYDSKDPDKARGNDRFTVFENYLRSRSQSDISWKMVEVIYQTDPDRAAQVIGARYLDSASQGKFADEREALRGLIRDYDAADADARTGNAAAIEKQLTALAGHPHWCVRAYALVVLTQARRDAPHRGSHWAKDSAVPTLLLNDANSFVRERAASSTGYYYLPDPGMRALFRGETRN